jgi:hypothetical protein
MISDVNISLGVAVLHHEVAKGLVAAGTLRGFVQCTRKGGPQRGLATPAPVSMRQVQV